MYLNYIIYVWYIHNFININSKWKLNLPKDLSSDSSGDVLFFLNFIFINLPWRMASSLA